MEALSYPFFQRALIAGLLASVACGIVGTYVVVKRISSVSGSLSHAAFGGVGLGYLLGFSPLVGAALFALGSSLCIGVVYLRMRAALDTLLSMMWSLGMALGMLFIALSPGYAPELTSYLFGSILFVPTEFLWFVAALDVVVVVTVFPLFGLLRVVSFDEEFATVIGVPVAPTLLALLGLIALTIVTLIKVVGVILVIALLTFPAAIARHWCEGLKEMMLAASLLAALTTTAGLFGTYWLAALFAVQVPAGPLVILAAALAYVASLASRAAVTAFKARESSASA